MTSGMEPPAAAALGVTRRRAKGKPSSAGAKILRFRAADEAPSTENDFERTPAGSITKTERNIRHALAITGIKLSYDAFARQRIIRGLSGYGPELTDAALDAMWIKFEREYRVRFTREHFQAVVRARPMPTATIQCVTILPD
jgi:hypothetical protein